MVSDVGANGGEGRALVSKIPGEELCGFCVHEQYHSKHALPSVIHVCQHYTIGDEWFFKRQIPANMYDCESPFFAAVKYDYKHAPSGKHLDMTFVEAKRNANPFPSFTFTHFSTRQRRFANKMPVQRIQSTWKRDGVSTTPTCQSKSKL
jgi:hypothetical protein